MNDSDEALVRRSQKSDAAAFEELVRRTARLVFSRIYLDTGNSHQAEDLVQETFLIAWRSIGQMTDTAGFRSWLLAIARTATLDALRRESRKKRTAAGAKLPDSTAMQQADPSPGPAQAAERSEERLTALRVLRSLPAEYREPLTLRYLAGADYDAIGQQLGLTNGSLRGLLSRGMARLREGIGRKTDE